MKTYTFPERRPNIPGPWMDEPDKAQWIDTVTGLDCLIVRNHFGGLCGYVGVQPGHKWHGKDFNEVEPHPNVHGGLTFANFCAEGEGVEEGPYICHIPEPGRPENVWWLGFDCGHIHDYQPHKPDEDDPLFDALNGLAFLGKAIFGDVGKLPPGVGEPVYRDFEYVKQECASLAFQIHEAAA